MGEITMFKRMVVVNGVPQLFEADSKIELVAAVVNAFPQIQNWGMYNYKSKRGQHMDGDCVNTNGTITTVSIPAI
jgi:hypothetical protein